MNRRVRIIGILLVLMFVALMAQLTNLQVVQADALARNPLNTRTIIVDFSRARGQILASDGTVLVRSFEVNDAYKYQRQYTAGPLYAPITGFFSFNYGTSGIEKSYADQLSGKKFQVRSLPDLVQAKPTTQNVQLHVDPAIQKAAAQALGNRRGAVVAMDPRTGAVKAMASSPSYDPGRLADHNFDAAVKAWGELNNNSGTGDSRAKPLLPRPYRETYAPGSTFKVVPATAAAADPVLSKKQYPRLRSLKLKNTSNQLPNYGGSTCGGDLADLLRVSCNTGFGQVGIDLGPQRLSEAARAFGFGERPEIDLPSASVSRFPSPEKLKEESVAAYSAIGQQDVSASPLQMCLVAAGIANNGVVMAPRVADKVLSDTNQLVETIQPKEWKKATDPATAAKVRDMMVGVVKEGTGSGASIPGIQVAAKTGTAQTVGNKAHAWMIGFAPADNPTIAVAVVIEEQEGLDDVSGGRTAAPVLKATMQAALKR